MPKRRREGDKATSLRSDGAGPEANRSYLPVTLARALPSSQAGEKEGDPCQGAAAWVLGPP